MTTETGDDIEVYDFDEVENLLGGENILYTNHEGGEDYIENVKVIKEGDDVWLKGYSIITGDETNYCVPYDTEVGLWQV